MPWISPGPVYGLPGLTGQDGHDPRFKKGPAASFTPRRDRAVGEAIPGPGAYDPQSSERRTKKNPPAFTIAPKVAGPREEYRPGPGEYDPDMSGGKKGFTLAGRPRSHKKDYIPGPGDYDYDPHTTRVGPEGRKGFVLRGRDDRSVGDSLPGPGAYDHTKAFDATHRSVPAASMRGKERGANINHNPGPGEYDPSWNTGAKAFSMGGVKREPKTDATPGPGSYNPDLGASPRTIKITGRGKDSNVMEGPGPADYEFDPSMQRNGKKGGPAFSIGTKREVKQTASAPGPGAYDPLDLKRNDKGATMRGRVENGVGNTNPGPGSYTPDLRKPKGFTIGTKLANQRSDSYPGPGEYTYDEKIGRTGKATGPQFAFRGRPKDGNIDDRPGPGYYDSPERGYEKVKKGQPAFSMNGRTEGGIGNSNPGPGSYEVGNDSPRGGFQIRGKLKDNNVSDAPGPGHYEINHGSLTNRGKASGPNYTFGNKANVPNYSNNPGPGEYSPENSPRGKNGQGFKIGERLKDPSSDGKPGPGYYDPKDSNNVHAYTYRPGKLDRSMAVNESNPGPTNYNVDNRTLDKTRKSQPAFSMGAREDRGAYSDTPGPGHYLPDLDKQDLKGKGNAPKIRGRGKDSQVDNSPGPAYYDPDPMMGNTVRSTKPKLPQHTISKRQEQKVATDTPGPGQYDTADFNKTKRKQPAFTMGARIDEPWPPKFPARNPPANSRAVKT